MSRILLFTLAAATILAGPLNAQERGENENIRETRKARRALPAPKSITGINLLHLTDENVGMAISYERFFKGPGIVSLYLPVSFALPQNDWSNGDDPVIYNGGYYGYYPQPSAETNHRGNGMVYFYPGIKIYPAGSNKRVSYSVGASLVLGVGNVEVTQRTYAIDSFMQGGGLYYRRTMTSKKTDNEMQMKTGFMVTNALNLRPTNKLYLGLELGVGYSYLHMQDGQSIARGALAQAGLKIGYVN